MADLSSFVPEERDFLSGVFYVVGVWISHVDDDGDCSSDAQEEKILMKTLEKLADEYQDKAILVSQMCQEAARQKENHSRWGSQSGEAIQLCVKAGRIIQSQMDDSELLAYKEALAEVARSVAVAFREGDDGLLSFADKIRESALRLFNKDLYAEQNISPSEETALYNLLDALKTI